MRECPPDASIFVIFGVTGDLAERKLLPALAHLRAQETLPAGCIVLGVGRRTNIDDESFRASAREAIRAAGADDATLAAWRDELVHYQCLEKGDETDMPLLGKRLAELEAAHGIPPNRTFYLSLPPGMFAPTISALGKAGLSKSDGGWTRLVVEKPFGRDLESAAALNEALHAHFEESQIYRIDHYLGKETVQNLLVFRLANPVFEALWNRSHVEAVQILVGERLGVEDRAGYYDRSGALRDMVQNHLTQLVTLIAMGVPARMDADSIRQEKVKVLHSMAELRASDVVLGRYAAGKVDGVDVPGYLDEPGVPADSLTETYVSMALHIENWRWQGVPFYVRTGKRLARRMTQIAITFREPPVHMFHSLGTCHFNSNVLVITLQPDEGFELYFDVKKPGDPFELQTLPLSFRYGDRFEKIPEAYETLLLDVLEGDQTLFVHSDEVEASWKFWSPVLATENDPARRLHPYAAGSWGPKEAERHFVRGAPEWLHEARERGRK